MRKTTITTAIVLFLAFNSCFLYAGNKSKYVDLFIGTSGDNGQVDPAACVPYGMVRICPDMKPRTHSGYDYTINSISGFSVNRLSGIGCGGNGGNLSIKPVLKEETLSIIKSTEKAYPGYYSVSLNNGVNAEFTATQNVAVERFYFPGEHEATMTLNVASSFTKVYGAEYKKVSDTEIEGFVKSGTTCDNGSYKIYFNLKTSKAFKEISGTDHMIEFSFGSADKKPIEIRIALSAIDMETARHENLRVENMSFDQLKSQAITQWNDLLNRVEVSGGTADDKVLFYTSLYRIFLSPVNTTSWDKKFMATDGSIQQANDFIYYSSWSMWDSYRTKFPLITLLEPEKMKDMCKSLSRLYLYGKKDWATPYESVPTVRTEHTITILLDAYQKGIRDIDLGLAYKGMKEEVDRLKTTRPDQALETCIDLWSMSRIAEVERNAGDARIYGEKADQLFKTTWGKEFKNIDSSYVKMRNSGLYQGTRWQYRWALPQYLDEMKSSVGDGKILEQQLELFFSKNLNNQGNEAGIHAPFIFNRLGRPDLTQQIVTAMLTRETTHLYGGNAEYPQPLVSRIFKHDPKGYLPEMDEDDGTMSAWYVFASIGLYPLIIGEPFYEISSPIFDSVSLKLDDGKTLKIQTKNRKNLNDPVKLVRFNGKLVSGFRLDHNNLAQGGILELEY